MNKSESKYFNTARLMDKALIDLLEEKDLEYITVKEICLKAGVNRSTFYLHYATISDLLSETMEYINSEFAASFETGRENILNKINDAPLNELIFINDFFLEPYLNFILKHQNIFRASLRNPKNFEAGKAYQNLKHHILESIMERFQIPKEEQNYWIRYYIGGLTAIIDEWINRDCKDSIEQIKTIMINCVRPESKVINKKFGE